MLGHKIINDIVIRNSDFAIASDFNIVDLIKMEGFLCCESLDYELFVSSLEFTEKASLIKEFL